MRLVKNRDMRAPESPVDAAPAPYPDLPPNPTDDLRAEILFWETIRHSKNPDEFKAYLAQYPNGKFAVIARLRLPPLEIARRETPQRIVSIILKLTGLDRRDLMGPRRSVRLARPRQVAMVLMAEHCKGMSLPQIGRMFGGRDHTTVMHAMRVIHALVAGTAESKMGWGAAETRALYLEARKALDEEPRE
jgi:hypothetical protein